MIAASSIAAAIALMLYFVLPVTVAAIKRHQQPDAVVVLNLVLGWTFIGVALMWAMLV